jgi:hypothetical protein
MASIAPETVYTKTAKGILEIRNKTVKLSRELGLVFLSIDGRTTVGELAPRSGMTTPLLHNALQTLVTDGYIKVVAQSAPAAPAQSSDDLDFASPQAMAKLNMEAASRALAAADATKRAQAEARAALDARMRQESEARARVLAETRAEAEASARQKADDAARAAAEERSRAEAQASEAADADERAQAEARARTAAAAVVRAQAEARVRAEAEERAKALATEKRAAEEQAAQEAAARSRSEEQAHARAAAETRASEALEAQVQAMEGVRAAHSDNPQAREAEAARARVRELEAEAERAREAARAIAEAEGRADEVPQPELDIADRVRQLNARVLAARTSREDAARQPRDSAVDYAADGSPVAAGDTWPALQLGAAVTAPPVQLAPSEMVDLSALTGEAAAAPPGTREAPPKPAAAAPVELPVVDLGRTQPIPDDSEHVPTALERAMAQIAAKARAAAPKAEPEPPAPVQSPAPVAEVQPEPVPPAPEPPAASEPQLAVSAEKIVPTIDDTDSGKERVNMDRAAHDILAEGAEARRKAEESQPVRAAALAPYVRKREETPLGSTTAQDRRRRKMLLTLGLVLVMVPVLAIAWLQFMPLNGYIPAAQAQLSQRLNQPVTISALRYMLLPSPRLVLEGVTIGATQGVRAERVVAHVMPVAALSGPDSFDTVEAHDVEIEADALGTLPAWTGGRTAGAIQAERLRLIGVKLKLPDAELEPFDGDIAFAPNGTIKEALFTNPKVKLELVPRAEGVRVTLNAVGWRIPYGPPVEFGLLTVRGLIDQGQVAAAELTGRVAGGDIEGAVTARWAGPITLQGEFKLERVGIRELLGEVTSDFAARGTLRAQGRFSMQAPDWARLTANPQGEATFSAVRGELTNIDIVRAIQSPAIGALRGGRTAFEELSGVVQLAGDRYLYRKLQLGSGPLTAGGAVDVGPGDRVSGRITAELAGRGARSTFVISGTVQDPQLQR